MSYHVEEIMQTTKDMRFVCIFMLICIFLNYGMAELSGWLKLPFWMDTIGTGLASYFLGTVCGVLCAVTSVILLGLENNILYYYILPNAAVALVFGFFMKKIHMNRKVDVAIFSLVLIAVTSGLSTIINCIFFDGYSSNEWGNGLFTMLRTSGVSVVISSFMGILIIDFADKIVSVWSLYGIILLSNKYGILKVEETKKEEDSIKQYHRLTKKSKMVGNMVILFCGVLSLWNVQDPLVVSARGTEDFISLYSETVYNGESGLSGGAAKDIAMSKDGYLWVATYSGLYRYDGIAFKKLPELENIGNINNLFVDEEGRLWIGTNDEGVYIYVRDRISNIVNDTNGLPYNTVNCIVEDMDGRYYIATSEDLCVASISSGLKIIKQFPQIQNARKITVSKKGEVAVVTVSGELFLIKDMVIVQHYISLGEELLTSCHYTDYGELLLGTQTNKIYHWDYESNQPDPRDVIIMESDEYIRHIETDEDGSIWICTNTGIGYLDADERYHHFRTEHFFNSVENLTIDYQKNIWFASSRLGLLELSKTCFANVYRHFNWEERVVNTIMEWEGNLYFGTDEGLNVVRKKTGRVVENELTKRLDGVKVSSMYVDKQNHLWIVTQGEEGLIEVISDDMIYTYNSTKGTMGDVFQDVVELDNGMILVGENDGLDFIENGKVVAHIGCDDGMTKTKIMSTIQTRGGHILAGSDGGGIYVISDNQVSRKITTENGLTSDIILRLCSIGNGCLVITSNSICYLDETLTCKEITTFPYDNNYDVCIAPNGNVWVLGSAGITVVDKQELIENRIENYELLDGKKGFKSSITIYAKNYVDQEGNLYLACNDGSYRVNMNHYDQFQSHYRMKLEYVETDGKRYEVDMCDPIIIDKESEKIVFSPVVLNYTADNPDVSYWLKGLENSPNVVKLRELRNITYTNLPSGKYQFQMSIMDKTGMLPIESISYDVEKNQQLWEKWWFKVYLTVVITFAIIYITWTLTCIYTNTLLERQSKELRIAKEHAKMGDQTILAIARTVDAKDENTSQHSERVSEYSVLIAERMGLSDVECEKIRKVALLHDIGKIGIPDEILNKPSKLTNEEYDKMKTHVEIGVEILKDFTIVDNIVQGVLYHHERYDGKGYVHGLKGEEIPLMARIICIADSFDAMTSNRVYRKHLDLEYVVSELERCAGTQFDPQITTIMLQLIREGIINPEVDHKEILEKSERS